MKHTIKITLILIAMFLVTQFIGLFVVHSYLPKQELILNQTTGQYENITVTPTLPYGMSPPEITTQQDFWTIFPSFILAFVIAIVLLLILSKYKWKFLIRAWFFVVIIIALGISFNSFLSPFILYSSILSFVISVPLAFFKVYRPSIIIHNFTELLIYPGIATVFVPILNVWTALTLLVLISIYDMWAVWRSKIMIKMAKFQMNELKIFGGFFVPYMTKQVRDKIAKMKSSKSKNKGKGVRVSLAILGGGDVVFPIIVAGVFLKFYGLLPAILVCLGAAVALVVLFTFSEKKKFYPAMPFISGGIFLALAIWRLFLF